MMRMALRDILDMIFSVIKTAEPVDILDILVLSYVVYLGMKLVRETRAGQLLKGVFLLILVYIISAWINMKAISYLLSETLNIGLIALIILFQPELRRTLEKAGYTKLGLRFSSSSNVDSSVWSRTIDVICDACVELSATSTGALIVIERQTRLGGYRHDCQCRSIGADYREHLFQQDTAPRRCGDYPGRQDPGGGLLSAETPEGRTHQQASRLTPPCGDRHERKLRCRGDRGF
jgi:DNA integrity scanning protein DisA with diadenylate cyclase activity